MTRAKQMLETYPKELNVDAGLLARTIEVLEDCANTCTQCADSCLSEHDIALRAKCIRLNLDCADVCVVTGRVTSRQTECDANVTRPLLKRASPRVAAVETSVSATPNTWRTAPVRRELPPVRRGVPRAPGRAGLIVAGEDGGGC